MNVWLVRAGKHGQYEQKFLQEKKIYVTWDGLTVDLVSLANRDQLVGEMEGKYPTVKKKTLINWASQVWPFAFGMQIGDWVIIPSKSQPSLYIGEITGDYQYHSDGPNPFFHSRSIKLIGDGIPRSHFGQDILYSLGAFLTICRIKRNNAVERLMAMRAQQWAPESVAIIAGQKSSASAVEADDSSEVDLQELAQDQIATLIEARFKGHSFTRLVDALLQAEGYTTWVSPEGADGGVDILVGSGAMGFDEPRICVEVKSGSSPIDRPTVDKLLGAMSKFNATQGLFISWAGFKSNVQKDLAGSFFRLRLWGRTEFLEKLFLNYDKLPEDIRSELPLKRIWTVAINDE